ncbi:MAG: SWIM zinc finger family protein [Anaerolineae bacterium]|nr:SWIM zinc finger family protein [Anaerolineae bacterium]
MSTLTESAIRSYASAQSFERGREYYQSGAIYNTVREGSTLLAECVGSEIYRLRISLDEGGIQSANCTCPYEMGGYCKHLVALLLTYIHKPDEFTERKTIPALLENVDKAALIVILSKLADRQPELYDWLETSLPVATIKKTDSQSRPVSQVSESAWRKRIKNILRPNRGYYDDYESAYGVAQELDEIVNAAIDIMAAGDAQGAITILIVLLEELSDAYEMFDDSDGELGDSADYAGETLAEAILSTDLTEKEREDLVSRFEPVAENLVGYGIEDGLNLVQHALDYGWDTSSEYIDTLEAAKLNVLERQGRTDEFLALCQLNGQQLRYVKKLLEIGRMEEGIDAAHQFSDPIHVLEVAKSLRESNRLPDAIGLAEYGLNLEGPKFHLATWLAPLEEAQGSNEQALQAHLAAFAEGPSLEAYKHIQRLSGERWQQMKPAQIKILLQSNRTDAIIDVYLHEQEWDKAIALAEQNLYSYNLREKVADAVIAHRPDWVIRVSIKEAEKLIEPTQSKYYPHAARWLAKAKQAYLLSGRMAEWQAYFAQLKTTYARRPSLQKELKKLA